MENIFFDVAASGRRKNRPGLLQMEQCLESKQVKALIVFTTNRLYRRAIHALTFVERLVKERKKRIVFVMNNIDSETNDKWNRFLSFLCLYDEFAAEMYVESIRASHIGKLLERIVFGTLTFGYHGVDIPGSQNRKGNPSRRIEIEKKSSAIAQRVFDWFVKQGLSINEIIRKLNADSNVPSPPKSKLGKCTRLAVNTLLKNDRYRGEWSYGKKESILISDKDYIRQDEREKPLKTVQYEELRIISDEMYYRAQQRLAEIDEFTQCGRKAEGDRLERLPKVLNGFFYCPEHDQRLHAGGPRGEYMICPQCHRMEGGDRFLFSQLNREVALNQLCSTLGEHIQNDTDLVEQIISHCQAEADLLQHPDAGRLEEVRLRKQKLKRSLGLLMRQEPDSDAEEQELDAALREKRIELSKVESDLARLESAQERVVVIPTSAEVEELLREVSQTLIKVVKEGVPEEIDTLRELIRRLTGGRIELFQQGERKAQRGWLQGKFRAPLFAVLYEMASKTSLQSGQPGSEIVVDFKAPDRETESLDLAWDLYQQGWMKKKSLISWSAVLAM